MLLLLFCLFICRMESRNKVACRLAAWLGQLVCQSCLLITKQEDKLASERNQYYYYYTVRVFLLPLSGLDEQQHKTQWFGWFTYLNSSTIKLFAAYQVHFVVRRSVHLIQASEQTNQLCECNRDAIKQVCRPSRSNSREWYKLNLVPRADLAPKASFQLQSQAREFHLPSLQMRSNSGRRCRRRRRHSATTCDASRQLPEPLWPIKSFKCRLDWFLGVRGRRALCVGLDGYDDDWLWRRHHHGEPCRDQTASRGVVGVRDSHEGA